MSLESRKVERLFKELCRAPLFRFPERGPPSQAPERHGVYAILSPRRKVLHVGRTTRGKRGLYQRLNNHLLNGSSFTAHYLKGDGRRLRGAFLYRFLEVPGPRTRALLEAYAIGKLCPEHLGIGEPLT